MKSIMIASSNIQSVSKNEKGIYETNAWSYCQTYINRFNMSATKFQYEEVNWNNIQYNNGPQIVKHLVNFI